MYFQTADDFLDLFNLNIQDTKSVVDKFFLMYSFFFLCLLSF